MQSYAFILKSKILNMVLTFLYLPTILGGRFDEFFKKTKNRRAKLYNFVVFWTRTTEFRIQMVIFSEK